MNSSDSTNKAGHAAANKVGGMRVGAHEHTVPIVRKEHERKPQNEEETQNNEDERELEKMERFEYEKNTRMAAADRQAKMYNNQPKQETINTFRQKENIQVQQPILHSHIKSGASTQS
ncbi:hypothetical protein BGW38_005430 [Lunasporangiospora selenospora]|uniref:Uncharacterized protein n=1 Tax=Lunasporangiospora selenospora TaxID=979761 RepID=A0A9P6KBE4_9FUNG|nr:hypothetical protein BGW38_005430 [Lunasporangiospora selenospora]